MNRKQRTLLDDILEELNGQVMPMTPQSIRESIAVQILTARKARSRIEEEGLVVRDPKGSVIAHPAIKIEADAIKLFTQLINKHSF